MTQPQIIFGGASFGLHDGSMFNTPAKAQEAVDVYHSFGHTIIDTSRIYPTSRPGTSEQILGQTDLSRITLDTKFLSTPGNHTLSKLQQSINESLAALRLPKVRILYLHFPDPETPLSEVMEGVDAIHKQGKFDQFGISNYTLAQISEILDLCSTHNYVKPTVYQGQYNLLARNAEDELLPLLRKHGVAFYAYSPAAGGVLNKKASTRFNSKAAIGDLFRSSYGSPAAVRAIDKVVEASEKHGLTGHAVTLNWVLHHSAVKGELGDGVVFGARTVEQVRETCEALQAGPLPAEIVSLIEEVWVEVKASAPAYSPWAKPDTQLNTFLDDRKGGK